MIHQQIHVECYNLKMFIAKRLDCPAIHISQPTSITCYYGTQASEQKSLKDYSLIVSQQKGNTAFKTHCPFSTFFLFRFDYSLF